MSEQQRQQFSSFISAYLTRVLNEEITVNQVPTLIREAVAEDFENKDQFVPVWVAKVQSGYVDLNKVPKMLYNQVIAELQMVNDKSTVLYVADIIDGVLEVEDVPENLQQEVKRLVESHIGKKLV